MSVHLDALNLRLSNERCYLVKAKTTMEKELRKVWISQIEKEIAHEKNFVQEFDLNDDEILTGLGLE